MILVNSVWCRDWPQLRLVAKNAEIPRQVTPAPHIAELGPHENGVVA